MFEAGTGAVGATQVRANAPGVFDGTGDVLHASGLAYRSNYGKPRSAPPPLGETFSACAAAMLVRREAFEAAEGFDRRYFCYFEDVDLGFRLRLLGWSVLQSPDAIVAHVGGGSAGTRNAFADFHGARNRLWTFVKCMPAPLFWALAPAHAAACALAATLALANGRGLSAWRGIIAGLGGLAPIWRARRCVQARRVARWRDIARALAWSPHIFLGRQPVLRPISRARADLKPSPQAAALQ
jgi:GT2 family glycosyltransferase